MRSHARFSPLLLIGPGVLALAFAVFQLYYFSVFTVDDAYISYRYAENFARGDGLVFNKGEYVEGYTNFLWVILLGLLKKTGIDVQDSSLGLGTLFSLMTLVLTIFISFLISAKQRQTSFSKLLSMVAVFSIATSPAFGIWAVAGLETPLFMCLLVAAIWLHLREKTQTKGFSFSSLCFGLLALTRPEGIMYFALTLFYDLAYHVNTQRRNFLNFWKRLLIFLCIVAPHFLWRWQYYNSWLPNTYYMKVGKEFYFVGVKYVYEFFFAYGGTGLFLLCCMFLIAQRVREYWVGYFLFLLGVSTAYFIYVGGDWMPEFRFFVPILPLFFLCIQEGIRAVNRFWSRKIPLGSTIGTAIVILAVLGNNFFLLHKAPRINTLSDGHVIIGKLLRAHSVPTDVLAAIDIGAMAYFSKLRTIDYFGLADSYIARLEPKTYTFEKGFWGHHTFTLKSDTDYVLSQQPKFIELNTSNAPKNTEQTIPADPYSELMLRNPTFRNNYIPFYHTGGSTIFVRVKEQEI